MASQYASSYPVAISFNPQYKDFFENFYKISDTPEAHEQYSEQFTEDATLKMASKAAEGRQGIFDSVVLLCLYQSLMRIAYQPC